MVLTYYWFSGLGLPWYSRSNRPDGRWRKARIPRWCWRPRAYRTYRRSSELTFTLFRDLLFKIKFHDLKVWNIFEGSILKQFVLGNSRKSRFPRVRWFTWPKGEFYFRSKWPDLLLLFNNREFEPNREQRAREDCQGRSEPKVQTEMSDVMESQA